MPMHGSRGGGVRTQLSQHVLYLVGDRAVLPTPAFRKEYLRWVMGMPEVLTLLTLWQGGRAREPELSGLSSSLP